MQHYAAQLQAASQVVKGKLPIDRDEPQRFYYLFTLPLLMHTHTSSMLELNRQ